MTYGMLVQNFRAVNQILPRSEKLVQNTELQAGTRPFSGSSSGFVRFLAVSGSTIMHIVSVHQMERQKEGRGREAAKTCGPKL